MESRYKIGQYVVWTQTWERAEDRGQLRVGRIHSVSNLINSEAVSAYHMTNNHYEEVLGLATRDEIMLWRLSN